MNSNLHLHFGDGRTGVARFDCLRDAADMFAWFDDDENRTRCGIRHCWVTEHGSAFVILGDAPQGWCPSHPVREQALPHTAHP